MGAQLSRYRNESILQSNGPSNASTALLLLPECDGCCLESCQHLQISCLSERLCSNTASVPCDTCCCTRTHPATDLLSLCISLNIPALPLIFQTLCNRTRCMSTQLWTAVAPVAFSVELLGAESRTFPGESVAQKEG